MIDALERTRREQAALAVHDQSPFVRVLARAEELEQGRWPVQGDPGDERPDVVEGLRGPFGRHEPTHAELLASRFRL